ncbi:MAG: aminoacyl-tRNA hydrolase [Bacteroidales bacterium]|nr:aminoacyl-tRNA hydrolase [Bacteroidales bacterium]
MITKDDLNPEIHFTFSRSSGPGGQSVNKVNTKVTLRFCITESTLLDEEQKDLLLEKLENRINNEGELLIISQSSRSQLKNREEAIQKFYDLLNEALKPKKKRKATKPTRSSKEKRLKDKKVQSEKKIRRNTLL